MSQAVKFEIIKTDTDIKHQFADKTFYRALVEGWENIEIDLHTLEGADVDARVLVLGKTKQKVVVKGKLDQSKAKINLHIITLGLGWDVQVDGWIWIPKGVEEVEGYLLEENIFLLPKGKISAVPRLDVRSNNVKASHWAKIHSLSPEHIFYLRAKGIDLLSAKILLVSGFVNLFFEGLDDEDLKNKVMEDLKSYLEQDVSQSASIKA